MRYVGSGRTCPRGPGSLLLTVTVAERRSPGRDQGLRDEQVEGDRPEGRQASQGTSRSALPVHLLPRPGRAAADGHPRLASSTPRSTLAGRRDRVRHRSTASGAAVVGALQSCPGPSLRTSNLPLSFPCYLFSMSRLVLVLLGLEGSSGAPCFECGAAAAYLPLVPVSNSCRSFLLCAPLGLRTYSGRLSPRPVSRRAAGTWGHGLRVGFSSSLSRPPGAIHSGSAACFSG